MIRKTFLVAGAAIAAISTAAYAAVIFDTATGTGFVGKGDVQLVYGQTNAQIQNALIANPQAYTFSYNSEVSYDAVCEWDTVTGGKNSKTIHHVVTRSKSAAVNAAIDGAPRKTAGQKQFTGFNLLGFGAITETGDPVPLVGDVCVGDEGDNSAANGVYTSVTLSTDNLPGSLYVTYLGNTQPLPITPVL